MPRFILLVFVFILSGCAKTTVITVIPPDMNSKFNINLPYKPPVQPKIVKYDPKNDKKMITVDNVTVEILDIVSSLDDSDYAITLQDPWFQNKEYKYALFPMMLQLKVTNNTEHIITLRQTIVKLEDNQLHDYPMVNTFQENKQKMINAVRQSYQPFIADLKDISEKQCIEHFNTVYKQEYDRFVSEIDKIRSEGKEVRLPITEKDTYYTESGIKNIKDIFAPAKYLKMICNSDVVNTQLNSISQRADKNMQSAIQQIQNLPDNIKNTITNGVYQPINIIPGREELIFVPFGPRKENEEIKILRVGVYDLPTKVDNAGNPIKRAHFNFEMIAEN